MPLFPAGAMSLVRRLAQSHLLSAARMVEIPSGRTLLSALRESGIGYRTQDFYSDWSYWREAVARGKKLKYTWKGEVLSKDLYMQTGYEMRTRYETLVQVTYRDPVTRKIETQYVTIAHEHVEEGVTKSDLYQGLTRGQVEDAAKEAVESKSPGGKPEIIHAVPIMGFVNPIIG